MNFRSVSLNLTRRFRQIFFVCRLLFVVCLKTKSNLFPNNNLTVQTRNTVLSKQIFVIQRGKREYKHLLYPVNHLNQRKSPSATLVSKEIETDFRYVFFQKSFFPRSRKFPKVMRIGVLVAGSGESWGSSFRGRVRVLAGVCGGL